METSGSLFRSWEHGAYFLLCAGAFVWSFFWLGWMRIRSRMQRGITIRHIIPWYYLMMAHGGETLLAMLVALINMSAGTPVNGEVFSVDCIWFNGIMCLIYFVLWKIGLRHVRVVSIKKCSASPGRARIRAAR